MLNTCLYNSEERKSNDVNKKRSEAAETNAAFIAKSSSSSNNNNNDDNNNTCIDDVLFDRKIELITEGIDPFFAHKLLELPRDNALTIVNYILSMRNEINLSDAYRRLNIYLLYSISSFFGNNNNKQFKQMTRDDILQYLDSLRKPEASDPLHKWIGTYNLYRTLFTLFFKWLYYPDIEQNKRPKPSIVENIARLRRREQSIYKPSDLWNINDDLLFLKYCPSARERCYHMISRDLSCRPQEIMKLKLKDINFKNNGDYQYAEVLLNGKTGSRSIPLINSIPYLKDWIDQHPQKGNPNSYLICGFGKSLGRRLNRHSLYRLYQHYRQEVFPKLLESPDVT